MVRINNENEVAAYHVIRVFAAIFLVLYVVTNWIFPEYFGLFTGKTASTIGAIYATIYIIAALYLMLKGGVWFVEFVDSDTHVEFRYYYLTTPFGSKRMVRIKVEDLYAFKVEETMFGLKKKLILYQEREGKLFQYPPVPVGSLFQAKRDAVTVALEKYSVKI